MMEKLLPINATDNLEDLVVYYHNIRHKFEYKEICSIIPSHHKKTKTVKNKFNFEEQRIKQEEKCIRGRSKRNNRY